MKTQGRIFRACVSATGELPLISGAWTWKSWWYSHHDDAEAAGINVLRANRDAGRSVLPLLIEHLDGGTAAFVRHRCRDRIMSTIPQARHQRCKRCGAVIR